MGFRSAIVKPKTARLREYTLYIDGPYGSITNKIGVYARTLPKMWVAKVRAGTIKQAYAVLAHQQLAGAGRAGVVTLDNSHGPSIGWPWDLPFDVCAPGHWTRR